jgi:Holliday junction resolvasome RuvABC endonuclease subunit
MPVIVGIDPGISNIGFACLDLSYPDDIFSCTCHASPQQTESERLAYVRHFFTVLQTDAKGFLTNVDTLITERQPGKLTEIISWATGIIIDILSPKQIISVTPCELKKNITGYGASSKNDLRDILIRNYELDIVNVDQHQVDAMALVLVGRNQRVRSSDGKD